jgi:hypothetical protein
MAVAFPIGVGLALVIGVVVNYLPHQLEILSPVPRPVLVVLAIIIDAVAYETACGEEIHRKRNHPFGACGYHDGFLYSSLLPPWWKT